MARHPRRNEAKSPGGWSPARGARPTSKHGPASAASDWVWGWHATLAALANPLRGAPSRLVATADGVVENYAQDVLPKLGLGYADLVKIKPDLVMVSMPAFGGAYSDIEIAAVANYVTARFGGKGSHLTAQDVAELRKQTSE